VADTSSAGTTYTASGLSVGTSYNFNVAAINSIGTGADGNTPSLSTASNMSITVTGSPTETVYAGYKSFAFTGSGTFEITANPNSNTYDVMFVGGGGGCGGQTTGLYPWGGDGWVADLCMDGRFPSKELLDGVGEQSIVRRQPFHLSWELQHGKYPVAYQGHRRLEASREQAARCDDQFVVGESLTRLPHGDQLAQDIIAGSFPPVVDNTAEVVEEVLTCLLAEPDLVCVVSVRREHADHVRRPGGDQVPVCGRNAKHPADDLNGHGLGELVHHLHLPTRDQCSKRLIDDPFDVTSLLFHGLGREDLAHESAEATVGVGVGRTHAVAPHSSRRAVTEYLRGMPSRRLCQCAAVLEHPGDIFEVAEDPNVTRPDPRRVQRILVT
jgi:hypothetical protein